MKTSLSWLKTHLDTEVSMAEIAEHLVMLGHDVEGVEDPAAALAPFVAARVVSAEKHPQADRLRVCVVDNGREQIQVVCGAPNARAGMIGVFGRAGVTVPKTGAVLNESAIRGVVSRGMLMSAYELALSDDHEGIIELPDDTAIGTPYVRVAGLDDPVIDLKVTPNRADCLGMRGLARDLAAAGIGTMKPLDTTAIAGRFKSPIAIRIEDYTACPQFLGRHIRGLRNGTSPTWLRARLESIGLRPISALV
ncbi:MAG: YtpR family tRNA-binding protein, partial [Stellaceae bacterium]